MKPTFEDEWRERFSEFAELRDDEAGIAGWSATGLAARVRRFRSLWRAPLARDALWLDAGCGAGTYMRVLAEAGQRVIGVDYSLPTLRKCPLRPIAAADVRALPFSSATFDGVLCFGVLQALAESRVAIAELVRQLKPGGELWVDALSTASVAHRVDRVRLALKGKRHHLRHESPRVLRRILGEQGLVDVKLYWMPIAPSRLPRLQRLFETGSFERLMTLAPPLGGLASHAFILHARKPSS